MKAKAILMVWALLVAVVSSHAQETAEPAPASSNTALPAGNAEAIKKERVGKLLTDARHYMEAGKFSIAVDIYNNALLIEPKNVEAREGLEQASIGVGKERIDEPRPEEKPLPTDLEGLLARALKESPLLRVAAAELRRAEAELLENQLRVAREVTTKHYEIQNLKEKIPMLEQVEKFTLQRQEAGRVTPEEGAQAAMALMDARQQLRLLEAELEYLIGVHDGESGKFMKVITPMAPAEVAHTDERRQSIQRDPMPEMYEKMLDRVVDIEINKKFPEIASMLSEKWGVTVISHPTLEPIRPLSISLRQVTWRQALEAISDLSVAAFIFRDYGVLIVQKFDGSSIAGAAIPSNLPLR